MRTIGAHNIKKLKQIIKEESDLRNLFGDYPTPKSLSEAIHDRIPDEWYGIWEMAHQEIERIINDELKQTQN